MDAKTEVMGYHDRSRLIMAIGALFLLAGIAIGLLAPVEMYCFYLFSEGGRFHYDGFGFGSFMFGNITAQIVGYYLIAALLIPLGYGHLRLRRWARPLALTLLWAWLVVGFPVIVIVAFILLGSKDLSLPVALIALLFLALSYLAFPGLLIQFYRSRNVRGTFEARDPRSCRLEALPVPVLVLSSLYLFFIVVLHLLILFNGIFPLFGTFVYGMQGILLLEASMVCLGCLTWGTLRQQRWAWPGAVLFVGLFALSTILTLVRSDYATILSGLAFPPTEMEILAGIPARGYHFVILAGIPLIATWLLALLSGRHFGASRRLVLAGPSNGHRAP